MSPKDREAIAAAQELIYRTRLPWDKGGHELAQVTALLDRVHDRSWKNPDRSPRWQGYPRVPPTPTIFEPVVEK